MTDVIKQVPLTKITKGRNPRQRFDPVKLAELAGTIKEHGLIQPITLEPEGDGFVLIAGERRLRAHEMLGKKTIKSIIRERTNHNGRERFLAAVIENVQREDMNPIEEAKAFQVLMDDYQMTVREISRTINKSEVTIYNSLQLLMLDPEIQDLIEQGLWKDSRFARGLLDIEDSKTRIALAEKLFKNKVQLKDCLAAVGRTQKVIKDLNKRTYKTKSTGTPAFGFGDEPAKPLKWDAMRQAGKVPEWPLVVHSVTKTCDACPLRDIANEIQCRECPTVYLLRTMMEAAK